METETFLLARRQLLDRMEQRRQLIIAEKSKQEQSVSYRWLGPVARWALSHLVNRVPGFLGNGLLSGVAGWLAATIVPQFWGSSKRSFWGRLLERTGIS